MTLDLTGVFHIILSVLGTILSILLPIYVPKIVDAFVTRNNIHLTDQQRATVIGAVQTAAGNLETKIDQGVMSVSQVHIADPTVGAQAQAAINAVPNAMAALGMTPDSVARMIVGATDTTPRIAPVAASSTAPGTTSITTSTTTTATPPATVVEVPTSAPSPNASIFARLVNSGIKT